MKWHVGIAPPGQPAFSIEVEAADAASAREIARLKFSSATIGEPVKAEPEPCG